MYTNECFLAFFKEEKPFLDESAQFGNPRQGRSKLLKAGGALC